MLDWQDPVLTDNLIKVFLLTFVTFVLAFALTPVLTHYLYKYKAWKKKTTDTTMDGRKAIVVGKLRSKQDTKVPRMGGLIVWVPTLIVAIVFFLLAH